MAIIDPSSGKLFVQEWDEAWYHVCLVLRKDTLVVEYHGFPDIYKRTIKAADFQNLEDLEDFIKKFRCNLVQLKDNECYKIAEGTTVCASYAFSVDDVRLYDAVVTDVNLSDHKFLNHECTCTFVLYWLYGPNAGKTTDALLAQISLPNSGTAEMDPILSSFSELCKKKLEASSAYIPKGNLLTRKGERSTVKDGHIQGNTSKKIKTCKHSVSRVPRRRSGLAEEVLETNILNFMMVDNLEKNLCPLTIVDFVKKHVSITCIAQVCPSSSSEPYTRGIIIADSQEDLLKLSDFLLDPAHMILSSRGRPWMTIDPKQGLQNIGPIILSSAKTGRPQKKLMSVSMLQGRSVEIEDNIKIVSKGTEEYERGKQLKDLYLNFVDYQRRLEERFAMEESKIFLQ